MKKELEKEQYSVGGTFTVRTRRRLTALREDD
jgi:hypothetical protein